jgi:hypothetical protein
MPTARRTRGSRPAALAAAVLALLPGCKLFQAAAEVPGRVLSRGKKDHFRPPGEVQTDVMRFADRFDAQIVQAAHDQSRGSEDPRARMRSLAWSIPARTAALTIASGPNPNHNLIDMFVLVMLGRIVHEERQAKSSAEENDDQDEGMSVVEAYRSLEADVTTVARRTLGEKQIDAIREIIRTWHEENPEQTITSFVRLPNFERLLAQNREQGKNFFEELGDLLSLDPLSGLEPAKREVAEARLLGERTLFYAQRAPLIFAAQGELLGLRLANMPQVGSALDKGDRISKAAASLADTAAGLPEELRKAREQAVEQISGELSKQRRELLRDLETSEAPLERLLEDFRTTAETTKEMSGAVQGAVESLDGFIARVREPSPPSSSDPEEPSRPFDVREYGEAASRIEAAAAQVNGVLEDLNRSQENLAPVLDQATARVDTSVRRAAAYALGVGLLLIGAATGAALLVRRSTLSRSNAART